MYTLPEPDIPTTKYFPSGLHAMQLTFVIPGCARSEAEASLSSKDEFASFAVFDFLICHRKTPREGY
jgi:hypothetical protein